MEPAMREDLTAATVHAARWIAVSADLLQIVLLPAFFPGALSPASTAIDVVVAAILLRLLGWHWAFLPTFVAELTPFVDLVPTWTGAVFLATRKGGASPPPEVVVETTARPVEPVRALPGPAQPRRDPSGE
jgi:hypothetical protein